MRLPGLLFCLLPVLLAACRPEGGTVLGRAPAGVRSAIGDLGRFPPGTRVQITGDMIEK